MLEALKEFAAYPDLKEGEGSLPQLSLRLDFRVSEGRRVYQEHQARRVCNPNPSPKP